MHHDRVMTARAPNPCSKANKDLEDSAEKDPPSDHSRHGSDAVGRMDHNSIVRNAEGIHRHIKRPPSPTDPSRRWKKTRATRGGKWCHTQTAHKAKGAAHKSTRRGEHMHGLDRG